MGHANLTNISDFLTKRLYRGSVTIAEAQQEFSERFPKDGVRASEGIHTTPSMICYGMEEVINFWRGQEEGPVVVPAGDLTEQQQAAIAAWGEFDDPDASVSVLDSIPWKYAPGWRAKHADVPQLKYFSN